jgi:hypothetical protein
MNENLRISRKISFKPPLLILATLVACSFNNTVMTDQNFQGIRNGSSISQVEAKYGAPVTIHHRDGENIYEYITTDYQGLEPVRWTRYFFVVDEKGQIKTKYKTLTDEPAFQILQDVSPP